MVASAPVLVLVLALVARLFRYETTYELHIDEAAYGDVSRNLATGRGLTIFGGPFHLHPPGYLLLLAGLQRTLGIDLDRIPLIEVLRPVGAVLGALTCVVVWLIVRRAAGPLVATLAALSLAVDPFANRWDTRLFLEAPAMLGAAVAMLAVVEAAHAPARRRRWWVILAGLGAGGAILTKEPYVFVSVLPLVVLAVTGRVLARREVFTSLAVAASMYLTYVTVIVLTGQWDDWWREKASGVARLVGLEHPTGFNAPDSESAASRVAVTLGTYGGSYAIVGLGVLAVVLLVVTLRRRRDVPVSQAHAMTVVAVWQGCAVAYVGYAVLFGTLEEQTFYLVLAPSLVAAATTLALLARRGRALGLVALALAAVLLVVQTTGWVSLHSRTDDGYRSLNAWVEQHLPVGTRVAMTEDTGQFLLQGLDIVANTTDETLPGSGADFVLVATALTERGYGTGSPELLETLRAQRPAVFVHAGESLGRLVLFDVRDLTGGSGVADGVDLPAVPVPERTSVDP